MAKRCEIGEVVEQLAQARSEFYAAAEAVRNADTNRASALKHLNERQVQFDLMVAALKQAAPKESAWGHHARDDGALPRGFDAPILNADGT